MLTTAQPKQHLRTDRAYNLHIIDASHCDEFGMPIVHPEDWAPESLTPWSSANSRNQDSAVHFFQDDYRFETLWNNPSRHLAKLRNYGAALTPDFSLYTDMPLPMQRWNVYRSRALGNYWQRSGIRVIPTLQWSTPDSYDFAFEGVIPESVYAVSTLGVRGNAVSTALWVLGMSEAIERLNPAALIIYGDHITGFDYGDIEIHHHENQLIRRLEHGRQRQQQRNGANVLELF